MYPVLLSEIAKAAIIANKKHRILASLFLLLLAALYPKISAAKLSINDLVMCDAKNGVV